MNEVLLYKVSLHSMMGRRCYSIECRGGGCHYIIQGERLALHIMQGERVALYRMQGEGLSL